MSNRDINLARYDGLEGSRLITALSEDFGPRLALVSSFGAEAAVLLDMTAQVNPAIPAIFLDTGKHFWQTHLYRSKLIDHLGLEDVRLISPRAGELARTDPGSTLSASDPDACCGVRKVQPLERALAGFDAVLSGRKRYHGDARGTMKPVTIDRAGRVKGEPLFNLGAKGVEAYIEHHGLPRHPLVAEGYYSIGCKDCTVKGGSADDPRAGRWAGRDKTECGIHAGADGRLVRTQQSGD